MTTPSQDTAPWWPALDTGQILLHILTSDPAPGLQAPYPHAVTDCKASEQIIYPPFARKPPHTSHIVFASSTAFSTLYHPAEVYFPPQTPINPSQAQFWCFWCQRVSPDHAYPFPLNRPPSPSDTLDPVHASSRELFALLLNPTTPLIWALLPGLEPLESEVLAFSMAASQMPSIESGAGEVWSPCLDFWMNYSVNAASFLSPKWGWQETEGEGDDHWEPTMRLPLSLCFALREEKKKKDFSSFHLDIDQLSSYLPLKKASLHGKINCYQWLKLTLISLYTSRYQCQFPHLHLHLHLQLYYDYLPSRYHLSSGLLRIANIWKPLTHPSTGH